MPWTPWFGSETLNWLFREGSYEWYYIEVALCRSNPLTNGYTLDEPDPAAGYGRKLLGWGTEHWSSASGGKVSNTIPLAFNEATDSWGTITHFALLGADLHGLYGILAYGLLAEPLNIPKGIVPTFPVGALEIELDGDGCFSDFLENTALNMFSQVAYYGIQYVYVGFCTADPTDAGTGADCSELPDEKGYARVETDRDYWAYAVTGLMYNVEDIVFEEATADWELATHWALFDSGVYGEGNMLMHGLFTDFAGELPEPKIVRVGDTPRIAYFDARISLAVTE